MLAKTRVNDIKLKQVPAQTLVHPEAITKVEDQPPLGVDKDMQFIVLKRSQMAQADALSIKLENGNPG